MNTTGYGYEPSATHGIAPEWIERIVKFKQIEACDVVQLHVRWQDLGRHPGNLNLNPLREAINYLYSLDIVTALVFRPYRNDDFIPLGSRATDQFGQVYNDGGYHTLALTSPFWVPFLDIVEEIARAFPQLHYMALGYGPTEEFFLPLTQIQGLPHWAGQCVYSRQDRDQFKKQFGTNIPEPNAATIPHEFGRFYEQNPDFLFWITYHLKGINSAFKNACLDCESCGFMADMFREQSAIYGITTPDIFKMHTHFYSSEAEFNYNHWKYAAVDIARSLYPEAAIHIEFDPHDLSGGHAYGQALQPGILAKYATESLKRGVDYIHWAMAFSPGTTHPDNITPLRDVVAALNKGVVRYRESDYLSVQLPPARPYQGQSLYLPAWEAAGGRERPIRFV